MKKLWFKKKSHVHGNGLFTVQYIKKGTIINLEKDKIDIINNLYLSDSLFDFAI